MNKRLLVVDDNTDLRKTVRAVLVKLSLEITEASDGIAALAQVEKQNYHVILTDIKMSGMDGLEFVKTLKSKNIEVPVIFYSGYADKETLIKVIKLGAFDFIEKPFTNERLTSVVKDALLQSDTTVTAKLEALNLKKMDIQILNLLLRGLSNKEIATVVNLSEKGVKYHVSHLLSKFDTTNRGDLREKIQALVGADA